MPAADRSVLLDGAFVAEPRTGSGQYTLALWREFVSMDTVCVRLAMPFPPPVSLEAADRVVVRRPGRLLRGKMAKLWWEQVGFPSIVSRGSDSLLHVPYFAAPWRSARPFIVTVHDVIPLVLPEYRVSLAFRVYLELVRRTVRRATLLLTDSEWSCHDIVRIVRYPRERIRVIPLGVAERFRPADRPTAVQALAQRWGIAGPVVLNLGGFDVRKNLPLLVRAFARALPQLPEGTMLVIPGRAHSGNQRLYPPLEPLIRALGLERRVLLPGPVDEQEKVLWYQLAAVYAYPSVYEGFGLSPLEAMACGTPVIAARRTSLPEVVGDAGLLVEPDEDAFAQALVRLLNDPALRQQLATRGRQRAAAYTWRRTALRTVAAYREAIALVTSTRTAGRS